MIFNSVKKDSIKNSFLMQPYYLNDQKLHSMDSSLKRYLEIKVHEDVLKYKPDKIIVRGLYDRENSRISEKEKHDKLFNWHRPTSSIDGETLFINVYPSIDYVRHYASLIKSYLSLLGLCINVFYCIPSEGECFKTLDNSNLSEIPLCKIAVIGYGLNFLGEGNWIGGGPFKFETIKTQTNSITLVGCQHSIWGDAGGRVVYYLMRMGFEKVIYIGKLGSMKPEHEPNTLLATGNCSYLDGDFIEWNNIFKDFRDKDLIHGRHYCCASILYETKRWVKENAENFDFVDPEIGQMAKYARSAGGQFSYLHIISDNLSKKYSEDLSNERQKEVILKRKILLNQKIKNMIYGL